MLHINGGNNGHRLKIFRVNRSKLSPFSPSGAQNTCEPYIDIYQYFYSHVDIEPAGTTPPTVRNQPIRAEAFPPRLLLLTR